MNPKTIFLTATIFFLPFIGFTQSVKEIDHVLMTSLEPFLKGFTNKWIVRAQCTRSNADLGLGIKMRWIEGSVDDGAQLQLTLEKDSIVTLI